MTYMTCPICRAKVVGGSVDELSQALRGHLADVHQMASLVPPTDAGPVRPEFDEHDGNPIGTIRETSGRPKDLVPDRQEVTDFVVRCPFCQAEVTGRTENDLGEKVGDHWSVVHGLRPRSRLHVPSVLGGGSRQ